MGRRRGQVRTPVTTFPTSARRQPGVMRQRSPLGRVGRAGVTRLSGRVRSLFETGGTGFRDLAVAQVFSTAADTFVALGLAGTLFFSVPSAEARANVVLYLLLTVAPFAVIGPTLGRILDRSPTSTRTLLVVAAAGRAVLSLSLVTRADSWWLFPAAFGLLVLSRVHGITRNSLLPLALDEPRALVAANARLAWIGMLSGAIAAGTGVLAARVLDVDGPLALAAVAGLLAALQGRRLPAPDGSGTHHGHDDPLPHLRIQRSVRMARLATAGVRAFNGFLLLLMAFALREIDASLLDFGALLGASGAGYAIASRAVPLMERRVSEEPMVVGALAITAVAAFSAGQWFGLAAAAVTAGIAGVAWGTAKLAFDGLLQATVLPERRGAAFTRSETLFSLAFVIGATVPTALPMPAELGLVLTGFGALAAQIVYVVALLVPPEGPIDVFAHTRDPDDGEGLDDGRSTEPVSSGSCQIAFDLDALTEDVGLSAQDAGRVTPSGGPLEPGRGRRRFRGAHRQP